MFRGDIRRALVLLAIGTGVGCSQSASPTDKAEPARPIASPVVDSADSESNGDTPIAESVADASPENGGPATVPEEDSGRSPDLTAQAKPIRIEGLVDTPKNGKTTVLSADDGLLVVAEGVGLDTDRALKHALSQAVRQVVGAYIDAETLVKNDQLVYDKVLTYSRGFVSDYKTIAERKIDGLTRVTIAATVHRTKLAETLKSVDVPIRKFPGRRLYATIVSEMKEKADATALSAKALFRGHPANLVTAEVIGMPKVVDKTDKEVTLRYDVRLAIVRKRYQAFIAGMMPLLEQVTTRKGSVVLEGAEPRPGSIPERSEAVSAWRTPNENLFNFPHLVAPDSYSFSGLAATDFVRVNSRGILTTVFADPSTTVFSRPLEDSRYDNMARLLADEPPVGPWIRFGPFGDQDDAKGKLKLSSLSKDLTIIVNTDRASTKPFRTTWRWYQIPMKRVFSEPLRFSSDGVEIFVDDPDVALRFLANRGKTIVVALDGGTEDQRRFWKNAGRGLVIDVVFSDDKGNRILHDTFPTVPLGSIVVPQVAEGALSVGGFQGATANTWILSPYVLHADMGSQLYKRKYHTEDWYEGDNRNSNWGYADGITFTRTIKVALKDLKSLNNVKATVDKNFAVVRDWQGLTRARDRNQTDKLGRFIFGQLDKDKDGKMTAREWESGGRIRAAFESKGIKLGLPINASDFLSAFARSGL